MQPAFPRPIVSTGDLLAMLDTGPDRLRIVDVRWYLGRSGDGQAAYDAGHIPGAIFLDLDDALTGTEGAGRHPLPSPTTFRARLEAAGIGSGHDVVAYDDVGGWVAARLWWMLDALGHQRVFVLDGGYPTWLADGLPISTSVPTYPPARLKLAAAWSGTIDRAGLLERLAEVVLLDARGGPRYRGETEPIDPVAGHIPSAINLPTDALLGADGRLLDPASLVERFRSVGADGSQGAVVTSCGSGVSACLNSLAMRLAGLPDPVLYSGSYSDWSRSGLPVAVGPEPGGVPKGLRGRSARPRGG